MKFLLTFAWINLALVHSDGNPFSFDECIRGEKFCIMQPKECHLNDPPNCEHGASVKQITWSRMQVEIFSTKLTNNTKIEIDWKSGWMGVGIHDATCDPIVQPGDPNTIPKCWQNTSITECAAWGDGILKADLSWIDLKSNIVRVVDQSYITDTSKLQLDSAFLNETFGYCRMSQTIQGTKQSTNKDVLVYDRTKEYVITTAYGQTELEKVENGTEIKKITKSSDWQMPVDPYMFMMHISTSTSKFSQALSVFSSIFMLFLSFLLKF